MMKVLITGAAGNLGSIITRYLTSKNIRVVGLDTCKQWKRNKVQFLHEEDLSRITSKVLKDQDIHGVYNLAPDDYSQINNLLPNKKYIKLPLFLIIGLLWILWYTRILNLRPSSFRQSVYPIVLSPSKLTSRYRCAFKYSSDDAFQDTLRHYRLQSFNMAYES